MQPDHLGCRHRFVEKRLHRFFHIGPELLESVSLGVDTLAQRGRIVAAVGLVLADFKNNLAHAKRLYPNPVVRKSAYRTPTPRHSSPHDTGASVSATGVRYAFNAGTAPPSAHSPIIASGQIHNTAPPAHTSSTTPVCTRITPAMPARSAK